MKALCLKKHVTSTVVPLAVRSKYEKALEKLVAEDFIEKVEHSECASPTVERCYSLLSRVGQIIWNQCSNLATAKGLTSLMKMVSSCGTRELLYQSHYRPFCWADLHAEHLGMVKMKQLAQERGYACT